MAWDLEWGANKRLLEAHAKLGRRSPALDSMPALHGDVAWVYGGFCQLCASRQVGQAGACPIQVSECLAWLELHGVKGQDERESFLSHVQALDARWLERVSTKRKSDADPTSSDRLKAVKGRR